MENLYLALGIVGIIFQGLVLYAMTRGAYREFGGVALYIVVLLLTNVAESAAYVHVSTQPEWYANDYYVSNTARHLAILVAVVSLIYAAAKCNPRRHVIRVKTALLTLAVIAASVLLANGPWPHAYMNQVNRNLSFATVILTVILWFSLVKVRTRDRRLLLVASGLGLNMAGEAIAQSLLNLARSGLVYHIASLISVLSELLCLWIWWSAFRRRGHRAIEVHSRVPPLSPFDVTALCGTPTSDETPPRVSESRERSR